MPTLKSSSRPTLEQHLHAFLIAHSRDISTSIQNFLHAWSELADWGEGKGDINRAVGSAMANSSDLALWMQRLGFYVGGFKESKEMEGEKGGQKGGDGEGGDGGDERDMSDSEDESSDSEDESSRDEKKVGDYED
jgi:hypothetical protein